jgi:hypothetical protein
MAALNLHTGHGPPSTLIECCHSLSVISSLNNAQIVSFDTALFAHQATLSSEIGVSASEAHRRPSDSTLGLAA